MNTFYDAFLGDNMKILLVGNSERINILKKNLITMGYSVSDCISSENIPAIINDDIVVLPIPSVKNGYINLEGSPITTKDLLSRISNDSLIVSCNLNADNRDIADLNDRDDFAYLNAIPTAEGAIAIAIDTRKKSLFYSKILITGFGRIAQILADRLKGLCPNITIAARSQKAQSCAVALGFNAINFNALEDKIKGYDIIFQTVPSPVLTENILSKVEQTATIIELSSGYIGTDITSAEKFGLSVIKAGGLPEKIAPETAGEILTESVISIIHKKNQN